MGWVEHAGCRGYPPELFLMTQRGHPQPGVRESVCVGCPVVLSCLADGWWDDVALRGAMLPRERVALASYLAVRRSTRALAVTG